MSKRILVVDDDPFDQALFRSAFRRIGSEAHIDIVPDVGVAMGYLQERPAPTLIVVDLRLRHESGLELIRWLRSDPRCRWIPAVTLSGSDDPADVRESYEAGANAYLVKPRTLEEIDDVVARIDAFWLGACALADDPLARSAAE